MEISARNQLQGTVRSVTLGTVMAEVVAESGRPDGEMIARAQLRRARRRLIKRLPLADDAVTYLSV